MFSIITLAVRSKYCILVTVSFWIFIQNAKTQNFTTKKNTSEKAKNFYAQGVKKIYENEPKAALGLFQKAESEDKNFIDAKIMIASTYLELKDTIKSLNYFNQTFELNCCYEARVPYKLGYIYYQVNDFKKAEKFFLKYIDNEKATPELLFKARKFARSYGRF